MVKGISTNLKILVLGGAGYIGSQMCKFLTEVGHEVIIFDRVTSGNKNLEKFGILIEGDISDRALLTRIFKDYNIDVVMHFAADSLVGESIEDPAKYFNNNVSSTLCLLDAMVENGVNNLIFSSTAATFGTPVYTPIDEAHPQEPINPYGWSKLFVERILQEYASAYGFKAVSLRYFNACGADPDGLLGECHDPETHLIPLVLQAASGRRPFISIFGTDYETKDGTCVRDYIHVQDLCDAHYKAIGFILESGNGCFEDFNLGNGDGFSVKEIIEMAKQVVAKDDCEINVKVAEQRPGDPAVLIADSSKAREILGWIPEYSELSVIISHAWKWEKQLLKKQDTKAYDN